MSNKNCKYDWYQIQKIYDETGITGVELCKQQNIPKGTLDLAISKGRFIPRPKKIFIPIEFCLECNSKLNENRTNNRTKFCNSSCSAKHSNKNRDNSFHQNLKTINCFGCSKEIKVKIATAIKNYKCDVCLDKQHIIKNGRFCKNCSNPLLGKQQSYCSRICQYKSINYHELGKLAGKASVLVQTRRSKNEDCFGELCKQKFIDVKTNIPIFNGWDADVILMNEKIAVLWNGIWHYKDVRKGHSFKKVQLRDEIKIKEIIKCGYEPYVIKDMGSHDKLFVQLEFDKFYDWFLKKHKT